MAGEEILDVIIFGASGFTGKYVIRELLKFTDLPTGGQRRVGIAGRSKSKLAASLTWALQGKPSPAPVSIFEANVEDPASLAVLVRKTKLLLNIVGPYRKYGEPVVKACVEAGIDCLDVTGEPEFMERMEAKYDEQAKQKGSLIVNACGYDSVPAELGVLHNGRQFSPPSLPQSCDSYLVLASTSGIAGNIGTWESAVLGIGSASDLRQLRKSRPRPPRPQIPGSLSKSPGLIHYENNSGTWAVKLLSADAIVVRRTFGVLAGNPNGLPTSEDEENPAFVEIKKKKLASIRPVQFGVYASSKSFLSLIVLLLVGAVFFLFAQFKLGCRLLLKYPEIFSLGIFRQGGPSEQAVKNASFQQWFVGKGFSDASKQITPSTKPDKQVVTRISGPEIGYVTTPICLVQAALIVLDQRKTLPKGGVCTPGVVFGITDYQEKLEKNGITFDVISTSSI